MTVIEIIALGFCAAIILSVALDVLKSHFKRKREAKPTARPNRRPQ